MRISLAANIIKFLLRFPPRRLMAKKFSLKHATLNIIEMLWALSRHKKPLFRYGLKSEKFTPRGVLCEWLYRNPKQKKKVIFYLHGGAYLSGGISHARNRSMKYALHSSASVFAADYRTSAVKPFPAALRDSFNAYKFLTELAPDSKIIVIGDSAGGGLALSTVRLAVKNGLKLPEKIILNSPWTDLTCKSRSFKSKQASDVVLQGGYLKHCARLYGGKNLNNPLISPIFLDYKGFPPIVINVGTDEILLDNSVNAAKKAARQGVSVKLRVWDGMFHMFHYCEDLMPESRSVCHEIYGEIDDI